MLTVNNVQALIPVSVHANVADSTFGLLFAGQRNSHVLVKQQALVRLNFIYRKMAADSRNEDYPEEIDDQLTGFDSSVSAVKTMLEKLLSMPRNELPQKVGSD